MKTSIVRLLGFCLLIPMVAHAQLVRGYGVKGGAVSATQAWDYNIGIDFPAERRWGVDVGAYLEILNIPFVSLLGELHYVQKGFSYTLPVTTITHPEGTGEFITMRPRVDYLSIPLLTKVRFDMGAVSPYIVGGPRLDVLVAREPEGTQPVLDNFKSTDVGGSIGAGIEVPLAVVTAVLAEFRYSPSFSDAFSNNNLTVKNKSFELLLGVRL